MSHMRKSEGTLRSAYSKQIKELHELLDLDAIPKQSSLSFMCMITSFTAGRRSSITTAGKLSSL